MRSQEPHLPSITLVLRHDSRDPAHTMARRSRVLRYSPYPRVSGARSSVDQLMTTIDERDGIYIVDHSSLTISLAEDEDGLAGNLRRAMIPDIGELPGDKTPGMSTRLATVVIDLALYLSRKFRLAKALRRNNEKPRQ